jgi:branched-chain amino acid transport system permease protein
VTDFVQFLVAGVALGLVYALVALGFVVIYRASKVFNFAHGEFLSFGALVMVTLYSEPVDESSLGTLGAPEISGFGLPWLPALLISVAATGLLAVLVERVVLRPLIGRPVFVSIILTLFVGILLRTLMMLYWGAKPIPMTAPWSSLSGVEIGGAHLAYNDLAPIVAALFSLLGFYLILRFSRLGIAMRATASDQEVSLALGIPVGRIFTATWFIAGAIAAIGGIFVGISDEMGVSPSLGFIAFAAFPAVIVGGLESPLGAVIAGLVLGVLQVLTQAYVNTKLGPFSNNLHEVLPYIVMIVFLVVRPYGLFGEKKVERL